ncbi:MAG: gamma-glutamyltransferase [Alphaproteobacteria bacterium]|jgi:gamma-glutamyltranspeptidase/glutathione hydrolase|nr:gamma-glutamyltransferase [Alphaproteobacteria bacterium]MDP6817771.1 gamma-glutamyltransferase [Alphaproteobacteria bacterium]
MTARRAHMTARLAFPTLLAAAIFLLSLGMTAMAGEPSPPARATKAMIAAANPLAAGAGRDILAAGGSAIDAAIAAQMVLGLVEPQSSGIGGGGFLLHYNAVTGAIESFDGREVAPAAADGDLFRKENGELMSWPEAASGGLSVGVPGLLRMLELAHRKHGRLPWARLFEPAIRLADEGFIVSPRMAQSIAGNGDLADFPAARAYFFDGGAPLEAGARLRNPAYAASLRTIAAGGADAFYHGDIAADIAAAVRGAERNPGAMTVADLETYEARQRPPVCATYRIHAVCGMGPPSSGGLTVLQILGLVEYFDIAGEGANSLAAVHLIAEASRLAFADRALFMADSDFTDVPTEGLLDRGYLAERAALIRRDKSMGKAGAGAPPGSNRRAYAMDGREHGNSTSHLAVVDAAGNAVSFTTSIERAFGSRLMVRGFLLNNQLTDFSFEAEHNGEPVANRVEGGKRPRSSMAPSLAFDSDGNLLLSLGSPGGSRIIGYVTLALIASLDWQMDPQAAVALAHHVNRNGATDLEVGSALEALAPGLEALGHEVKIRPLNSGLHAVRIVAGGLEGGADPRREGVALGQ